FGSKTADDPGAERNLVDRLPLVRVNTALKRDDMKIRDAPVYDLSAMSGNSGNGYVWNSSVRDACGVPQDLIETGQAAAHHHRDIRRDAHFSQQVVFGLFDGGKVQLHLLRYSIVSQTSLLTLRGRRVSMQAAERPSSPLEKHLGSKAMRHRIGPDRS